MIRLWGRARLCLDCLGGAGIDDCGKNRLMQVATGVVLWDAFVDHLVSVNRGSLHGL